MFVYIKLCYTTYVYFQQTTTWTKLHTLSPESNSVWSKLVPPASYIGMHNRYCSLRKLLSSHWYSFNIKTHHFDTLHFLLLQVYIFGSILFSPLRCVWICIVWLSTVQGLESIPSSNLTWYCPLVLILDQSPTFPLHIIQLHEQIGNIFNGVKCFLKII